ncbi:hypothetical protein [Flavonifractor sp. An92]|uniref:hypothetical protein n=1 Tax=Flavonifractor sp. An92 TaxID=1965666 RepID=UPI00117BDD4B|nr:hypothetical protein [Flavonifractor sp. An92]
MKNVFLRRLLAAVLFLALAVGLLSLAGAVLRPPQVSYGSTWRAYRAEPKNTMDVLYFGSSYAYCDFDPVEIYRHSGLTGYVMGGSEQTMSLTYWYLREALETQHPQAVVIEPTGVFFEKYQNYTQTNVAYMPLSLNKLGAIFTAAEPELRTGLLFDLWFYHSRWKEVRPSTVKAALTPARTDTRKGFTAVEGTAEDLVLTRNPRPLTDAQYEENLGWLLRCLELCKERGIQAIVLLNPCYSQCSPEQYQRLEADLAAGAPEATFVNWVDAFDGLGLVPEEHLYDGGHLNRYGAAIYAAGVAELLTEEVGLTPMTQTDENAAAWQAAVDSRDA